MSSRQSRTSSCFAVIAGIVVVFGGFLLWRGVLVFIGATDNGATPTIDTTAVQQSVDQTSTMAAFMGHPIATVTFRPSPTPQNVCQLFKVNVVRARIRECPKDTCDTISLPEQGSQICVYSLAPDATDWYVIDMNPTGPQELGYMSRSVLVPMYPTARPSATLNLATVTPVPSQTPTITPTPTATDTPDLSKSATPIPTNTATPVSPLQSAGIWRPVG